MTYCDTTCTIGDRARRLPASAGPDGTATLEFDADPGLYQLSVIVDAAKVNWDSLYVNLDQWGNTGQRTGPWDFNPLDGNRPVVPAYRVSIDGRYIGLWFFQRVSLEDIAAKRFRGNVAFWIQTPGEHRISLTPYRPMDIRWMSARLEPDPEDRLQPVSRNLKRAPGNTPIARWADASYWSAQRERLRSPDLKDFVEPLRRVFDGVMAIPDPTDPALIPIFIAAHHLGGKEGAIGRALSLIDRIVALPAWGNPNPDGYSHNGDMRAAYCMQYLAWALHMLTDDALGADRRTRVLAKLAHHGDMFIDLGLLNRDYWGGSLLQDHGRKSFMAFGIAALNLYGVIPQAARWLTYTLPRIQRSLDATPRDGVIPASSYFAPRMYLDDTAWFRDAHLAASGTDLFDTHAHLRRVIDYVYDVLHERDGVMLLPSNLADRVPLEAGGNFFARLASKLRDGRAQWLVLRTLKGTTDPETDPRGAKAWTSALWSFLDYEPDVVSPLAPPSPRRQLRHFEDTGLVHWRDDANDVHFSLQCGPLLGHHAYHKANTPNDRIVTSPGEGHFMMAVGGVPLLMTPDNGYRMHSFMRSCMLIDDKGQVGDVGYPMSIPSFIYRGQEVQHAHLAEDGRGLVRLDLKRAYPDELDVVAYTRDFEFLPRREILVRDNVVLGKPRRLSWLFQSQKERTLTLESSGGLKCRIGTDPKLWIEPVDPQAKLRASVRPTEIVWSYMSHSGNKPFEHVRYETIEPVDNVCVTFRITW